MKGVAPATREPSIPHSADSDPRKEGCQAIHWHKCQSTNARCILLELLTQEKLSPQSRHSVRIVRRVAWRPDPASRWRSKWKLWNHGTGVGKTLGSRGGAASGLEGLSSGLEGPSSWLCGLGHPPAPFCAAKRVKAARRGWLQRTETGIPRSATKRRLRAAGDALARALSRLTFLSTRLNSALAAFFAATVSFSDKRSASPI